MSQNKEIQSLTADAIELLKQLIATPSFSKEEHGTATIIESFLKNKGVDATRELNNVWARNKYFNENKPTILLNSHHDTVRPSENYALDPFSAIEKDGKLFGLGSNDAGGALVSLIATFLYFHKKENLKYNLIIAATAEEEISGKNGIALTIQKLPSIETAIVGEPTQMQMAIAERGLLVLECVAHGKAGHAAHPEGSNAIYTAMKDIQWFASYNYPMVSDLLGPVKMTVTSIETENKVHNIVPAECKFLVDIRINELYSHEEVLDIIKQSVRSDVRARSMMLRSSIIPAEHPLVQAGLSLGKSCYGSPTSSDKSLMPFPALKMGPGDSKRSHIADEFIFIGEVGEAIEIYIRLLNKILI